MLAVKLIQLLKLKQSCQQATASFFLKLLNDKGCALASEGNVFANLYAAFNENKVYPNDKEKFIINSLPAILFAKNALLAYKVREGFGFLNSVLAFKLETEEAHQSFFNEYSLTLRGRATQGVVLFKN